MKDLLLIYIFLIFSVGVFISAVIFNIYFRTRIKYTLKYLIFFSVFTVGILFWLFRLYLEVIHVPVENNFLYKALLYLECVVSPTLVAYLLILFLVSFFSVKNARRIVIISGVLAGISLLMYHLNYFLFPQDWVSISETMIFWQDWFSLSETRFLFICLGHCTTITIVAYSLIIVFRNYKTVYNIEKKRLSYILIAILFTLSFFGLFDFFIGDLLPFPVYPAIYCAFGIIFGIYLHRHYSALPGVLDSVKLLIAEYDISDRESEILELLIKGMSYKELSATLYISMNTVKTHVKSIYGKLRVKSRSEILPKLLKL